MRRILTLGLIGLLIFGSDLAFQAGWPVARLHAAAAFISIGCAGSSNDNNVSVTINTTGANFLAVAMSGFAFSAASPTDLVGGSSNTFTDRPGYLSGASEGIKVSYVQNPAHVGASHVFTYTQIGTYPSICAIAFSGMKTSGVYDTEDGSFGTGATSFQPGYVPPSAAGVVLSAMHWATSRTMAVNGSFTGLTQVDYDWVHHYGIGLAYLLTSSPQNPTWTWGGGSTNVAGTDIVFLETGGAPPTILGPGGLMGVGN